MKRLSLIFATAMLAITPVGVSAVSYDRASEPFSEDPSQMAGGSSLILSLLAVSAAVAAVVILVDDDSPASP